MKFCDLNQNVSRLLEGNAQSKVARLQALKDARVGGFILEVIKSQGRWSKDKYLVRRAEA
jgi:hypothetical protein